MINVKYVNLLDLINYLFIYLNESLYFSIGVDGGSTYYCGLIGVRCYGRKLKYFIVNPYFSNF